ncbi:MAG: helix-hairpin-helix domain-containing protein, partial [Bacteroidia bacterium]|nr:helix-hairpin-helix domain-containing protein [Bacteroidia bacterium]
MSKKIYPVLFFVFSFLQTFSQTDSIFLNKETNSEIEQKIENVAEAVENSSADYSTLLDGLLYYSEHPLNINTANASALSDLGLLTEIQINAIINYIKSNGKLISIYELQSIDELDMQTIQKILPYIKVSSLNENNYLSWKEIKKYGTHQLISRWSRTLEPQQGYAPIDPATYANSPNSRFLGNPDNLYLRYRFNYGNFLSAGFAAEKDAGEVFLNTKKRTGDINSDKILADKLTPGFDFYTAHIFARNVWKFKQIALGDYQISIGQGAVFSNGLAFGKTADILSIKRNAIGIKPYTSVNPSLLLRGAAMAFNIHNFEVMAWGSNKKVDGSVTGIYNPANDSTLTIASEAGLDDIQISSLQLSGYHRTPGELAKKNTITEQVA